MFKNRLDQLIWQRHRRMLFAIGAMALFGCIMIALIALHDVAGDHYNHNLVSAVAMQQWEPYRGTYFSGFSVWLMIAAWLAGLEMMHLDLRDNFNQFLFSSGFSRQRIYWSKIKVAFLVLLFIDITATAVQYLIYWVGTPHGYTWHIGWPGILSSWLFGLMISFGLFAISWFASLIIGQGGPLVVTIAGFTFSLGGYSAFGGNIVRKFTSLSDTQIMWCVLTFAVILALGLLIWGVALYKRLSLEHNGEYLMFPHLRVPVYIVFVIYVTMFFSWTSDGTSFVLVLLLTLLFGYAWLWRPRLGEQWHQWRERKRG